MQVQDNEILKEITRRYFFRTTGLGLGAMALSALTGNNASADEKPVLPKPHFPPKVKSVIFLFMAGGPSQIDLFDPKPKLQELNKQPIPAEIVKDERFAFIKGSPKLLGSPYKFKQYGQSGAQISNLLPKLTAVADELTFVKSMHTDQFNHAPAQIFMHTGSQIIGRPSMGAWLTYGLGSENSSLPGFVVLISGDRQPDGGKALWSNGFLPTQYQGVEFRSSGDPVLFLSNPNGITPERRRRQLDLLKETNTAHYETMQDPDILARISAYELAYKMQFSVPELSDISKETPETHKLYGTQPGKASFGNNCLLARRLVERGVRFVQLYHRSWDHHGEDAVNDLVTGLPLRCRETDQGAAALIQDLKARGLLDSTLVVWAGEFGRTPMNEERNGSKYLGRDHHPRAFTIWMAGAGLKKGIALGKTDELGYNPIEDPVHVHDLNATILHLLGLDHKRLTYKFQGREFRLTDVHGKIVNKLLG